MMPPWLFQSISLIITIATLVFAIGVWKGRNEHIAGDLVKQIESLKDSIERDLKKQQEEFDKYREWHHKTIDNIQTMIGGMMTVKEIERIISNIDKEHLRIWDAIRALQKK